MSSKIIPEATPIILTAEERAELEGLVRSTKTEHLTRFKARIVLLAADGGNCRPWEEQMSYIKTAADGRKLFFPWGVLGNGYLIASDADYERVRRMKRLFLGLCFVVFVALWGFHRPLDLYSIAAGYIVAYAVWMRFAVVGLQPTQERLSTREIIASHPKVYSPFLLWPLEIGALLFVIGGIVVLMKDPSHWASALSGVVFFGLCAAVFAYVLVVRALLHRPDN